MWTMWTWMWMEERSLYEINQTFFFFQSTVLSLPPPFFLLSADSHSWFVVAYGSILSPPPSSVSSPVVNSVGKRKREKRKGGRQWRQDRSTRTTQSPTARPRGRTGAPSSRRHGDAGEEQEQSSGRRPGTTWGDSNSKSKMEMEMVTLGQTQEQGPPHARTHSPTLGREREARK